MDDERLVPPRVAYAIGRKVGPAVRRNRLRRRLRAIVRGQAGRLAPGAYLIGAAPGAAELSFDELMTMFTEAVGAVGALYTDKPAAARPLPLAGS